MRDFDECMDPSPQQGVAEKKETGLTRIGPGFYAGEDRALYFNPREFLAAFSLPDTPEMRAAVWEEVQRDFGAIGIRALTDS